MCEPTTIIAAVSAVAGLASQAKAASAQAEAIAQAQLASNEATARQYQQVQGQAAEQVSERAKEAMIERGRLRVFAGESGLAGVSVDRIINVSRFNEGSDMATIEANRRNTVDQVAMDARAGFSSNQSRMNSIKKPDLIGAGLQIAGAHYQAKAEQKRIDAIGRSNAPTTTTAKK